MQYSSLNFPNRSAQLEEKKKNEQRSDDKKTREEESIYSEGVIVVSITPYIVIMNVSYNLSITKHMQTTLNITQEDL